MEKIGQVASKVFAKAKSKAAEVATWFTSGFDGGGGREMQSWTNTRIECYSLCLGGRSHEAYSSSFVCVCVCHYASVGGATRHTVIVLSVVLSVTPFLRRTLEGKL